MIEKLQQLINILKEKHYSYEFRLPFQNQTIYVSFYYPEDNPEYPFLSNDDWCFQFINIQNGNHILTTCLEDFSRFEKLMKIPLDPIIDQMLIEVM